MTVVGHSAHVCRGIRAPAGQQLQPSGGKFRLSRRKKSIQGGCVEASLLFSYPHTAVGETMDTQTNPGVEAQSR